MSPSEDNKSYLTAQVQNCMGILLALFLLAIGPNSARAQESTAPSLNAGWIVNTVLERSGTDATPLQINDGNATFRAQWAVLLEARLKPSISVFAEVQTIRGLNLGVYALSLVYRFDTSEAIQVEVGKFLAPFGTFLSRRWASENPLIDYPLTYNYRTAISASQLPRTTAILLASRGQGHHLDYPDLAVLGKASQSTRITSAHIPQPDWGLKVISHDVYLTGVQLFGSTERLGYAVALSNGAMSYPADLNNSNGLNYMARLRVTPMMGLDIGVSFSSAPYLNEDDVRLELSQAQMKAEEFRQSLLGADISYSLGHASFFAEALFNRWETPFLAEDLDVWGGYVEGKYTITPRVYLAARMSRMEFCEIPDPSDADADGDFEEPWDYGVNQLELGIGYRPHRNSILKAVYELNRNLERPGPDPSDNMMALQAVVFF